MRVFIKFCYVFGGIASVIGMVVLGYSVWLLATDEIERALDYLWGMFFSAFGVTLLAIAYVASQLYSARRKD